VALKGKNMNQLVEFPLQDGNSIIVEVDEPGDAGLVRAARPGEIVAKAQQSFEDALDQVKPAASAIIAKLRNLHDGPDEISVEFGIKLSAEAGAFIAAAGIEANYKVALKWSKSSKP